MKTSAVIFACIIGMSIAKPQFRNYNEVPLADSSEEFDQSVSLSMEESDEVALASSKNWQKEAVEYENNLRSQAELDPYKLDAKLNKDAQAWADKIASECNMHHDSITEGAESIAQASDMKKPTAELAKNGIQSWFDEVKDYDCSAITFGDIGNAGSERQKYYMKVGHFMNTMSLRLTKVGYGFAKNEGCGKAFTVARYGGQNDAYFNMALKKAGNDLQKVNMADMVPCATTE